MGACLQNHFMFFLFLLLLQFIQPTNTSQSHPHPLCHETESSALLHFKNSFVINNSASIFHSAYSKLDSWNPKGEKEEERSDCCVWDGVECDESSGHVIGLDLSSCSLSGPINSTSKIFNLVHLRYLNLADNDFNLSSIPPMLGHYSNLTHLNLSYSAFSGLIPPNISQLTRLTSLDLSYNEMLVLQKPTLGCLVHNLNNSLQMLHLNWVDMSSIAPHVLSNLSSLRSLLLDDCGLVGEFPPDVFKIHNLQHISVMNNPNLSGHLPEFEWSSSLETLWLVGTSFSGELPSSIGNLASMVDFHVWSCRFNGSLPSSLLNLTRIINLGLGNNSFTGRFPFFLSNLTNLEKLTLGINKFHRSSDMSWASKLTKLRLLHLTDSNIYGTIPKSFGNLSKLNTLLMSYNELTGDVPLELFNLTQLTLLGLNSNHLAGTIPSQIRKLSQITYLDLSFNHFNGSIPSEVFELHSLKELDISFNNLSGKMEMNMFLEFKNLSILHLSGNRLSLQDTVTGQEKVNKGYPKLKQLGLSSCNLTRFPDFISNQNELEWLELANNKIHGPIPTWVWNTSAQSLLILNLSSNLLTGFELLPLLFSPWTRLVIFDISHNNLTGSVPNPPATTIFFSISNNSLTGTISPLLCSMTSLQALDLSQNNLSGLIPHCLSSFSPSLSILNLRGNNLGGEVPETWERENSLKMINLSENKLRGKLPRSLSKCKMLESIDVSGNQINDTFPYWLGSLPQLKVLLLRSNLFQGEIIIDPGSNFTFCKLRIVDLSYNDFTGKLPLRFFQNWNPLKNVRENHLTYLQIRLVYKLPSSYVTDFIWDVSYVFSLTMVNKGLMMQYEKIQQLFTAVDFSSNRFYGEIPESISHMRELYLLNLSNNFLSGSIPEIFENLTRLESLDLSENNLSGQIPQQLTQLTFLEMLNVSCNNLTGPIPNGQQFNTFQSSSFCGNPGLCGTPLPNRCTSSDGLPPLPLAAQEDQESECLFCFGWKVILMGYAFGCVVGVIVGNTIFERKRDWFLRIFRWRRHKLV